MAEAIKVKNLVKHYGPTVAVNDISFVVEGASTFAFLGPNGAGKSTTIGCLTTLSSVNSGSVTINGHRIGVDDTKIRRSIGVVFQSSLLDPLQTVRENLKSRAKLYNIKKPDQRISELSDLIDMNGFLDKHYGSLSGGQKRRVDIARALVHKPSILFLDEPTAGLDPQSREAVWQTVYDLQTNTGLTVFLTTHYLEETERADMVYVIDHGKLIAHGTPEGLRAAYSKDELSLIAKNVPLLTSKLRAAKIAYTLKNETCIIHPNSSSEALILLETYKAELKDFEFKHGTMDDVFLELTRGSNHEEGFKTL